MEKILQYDVSQRLKNLREDKGISQAEFSRIMAVERSTVCLWENGKRAPQMEYVKKMCEYFDVDMNYLLGFSSTKHQTIKGTEIKLFVNGNYSNQTLVLPNELLNAKHNYRAEMVKGSGSVTIYDETTKSPAIVITKLA